MEQKIIFREMLSEIKTLADERGNCLTVQEVNDFFANAQLEQEQLDLIYEYLKSQKIRVVGYEKENAQAEALFRVQKEEVQEAEGEEMDRWKGMELYLEELEQIQKVEPGEELNLFLQAVRGDHSARNQLVELYLPVVCDLASEYEGEEYLVEDLIQEGNIGLMMALEKLEPSESLAAFQAQLMNQIRQFMEEVLKEQRDRQDMGRGIAQRVNHLGEAIRNLEEELEHKVSVEELSAYLEMPAEEILDILEMAGDELEVEGYEKK